MAFVCRPGLRASGARVSVCAIALYACRRRVAAARFAALERARGPFVAAAFLAARDRSAAVRRLAALRA